MGWSFVLLALLGGAGREVEGAWDSSDLLGGDMGVDLGGGDVFVAKEELYFPGVPAIPEKMGG